VPTEIRTATPEDIPGVLALWETAAEPTSTDSADALAGLLRRDPGALIVAEADGRIVGSVIAGWDGWRGSIYRLAVAENHRRRGLGLSLLRAGEDHLAEFGARRSHAVVVGTSARAVAFWRATDWQHQSEQVRFAKG
jgi:ribosomal protein S18 acetylase RimI-like enzyme